MKVAFVGAGRWALALGLKLLSGGHDVALYEPDAAALIRLLGTRRHPDLPESAVIPESLSVADDPDRVLAGADVVVFAPPSARLADAAAAVARRLPPGAGTVVSVSKGIDPVTLERMSIVLGRLLPGRAIAVLAGPGIPWNVAAGDPTSLVAASTDDTTAAQVRDAFTTGTLRVYSHPDVAGVELGAAFKNVIAVAAGIAEGLGLGINALAALLTRGIAEVTRLGLALDCDPLTFAGLSGIGDLIVTAFSDHSRNHQLGILLGRGVDLAQAQTRLAGVAEGATTARSGLALARKLSVEMPITEEVHRILYEGARPAQSLDRLLRRPPKKEIWQ